MRNVTMFAIALAAAGAALFFVSWPLEENFWANGGCGPLASCAYSGATLYRFVGLVVIGGAASVMAVQRLLVHEAAAPPHV